MAEGILNQPVSHSSYAIGDTDQQSPIKDNTLGVLDPNKGSFSPKGANRVVAKARHHAPQPRLTMRVMSTFVPSKTWRPVVLEFL